MAKKSLGQHFLKNKSAIRKIVEALEIKEGETIVEIGPGHGELTAQMADGEGRMVLIEKDAALCAELKKRFEDSSVIEVIEGDALKVLPEIAAEFWKLKIEHWKLAGNIPYYITGHLLRIVSELPQERKPERCVFTVQREVAERIIAQPPEMNRLAASVAYWADAKIIMNLSSEDFHPAPNVDSAIILLTRKTNSAFSDGKRFYAAVKAIFAQPRKMILNNLNQAMGDGGWGVGGGQLKQIKNGKEKLASALRDAGILPESRPQDLTIADVATIAKIFF